MREIEVEKLVEWLGRDGAIAGLEESDVTLSELYEMAVRYGLSAQKKMRRRDIIIDLVNRDVVRIDKTTDELLAMKHDDLRKYLIDKKVSRTELLNLASEFDIPVGQGTSANLVDFVAREISGFGMYQRVARGARSA